MANTVAPPDPKEADKIIGQHILTRRDRLGWSRKELADRITDAGLKMNPQVIYNLEAGERSLKLSEAQTLAEVLGVPVEDLLPVKRHGATINRNWIRAVNAGDAFKIAAEELIESLERLQGDVDASVPDRENMFGFKGEELAESYRHTLVHGTPARLLEFVMLSWLLERLELGEPNDYYDPEREPADVLSEVISEALMKQEGAEPVSDPWSETSGGPSWWEEDMLRFASMDIEFTQAMLRMNVGLPAEISRELGLKIPTRAGSMLRAVQDSDGSNDSERLADRGEEEQVVFESRIVQAREQESTTADGSAP